MPIVRDGSYQWIPPDSAGRLNLPDTVTDPVSCLCNCRIHTEWSNPGRWGWPNPMVCQTMVTSYILTLLCLKVVLIIVQQCLKSSSLPLHLSDPPLVDHPRFCSRLSQPLTLCTPIPHSILHISHHFIPWCLLILDPHTPIREAFIVQNGGRRIWRGRGPMSEPP